ncbi:MAG TPA: hypothetical protein VJR23_01005 [Candidatus Acidoferrales bacterium]|nr:hypothetical protein [Candidatus Acidoferrales bacterium]
MASPGCSRFLNHIESWMNGDHSPEAQAHLGSCSHCRGVLEDLSSIQAAARDWAGAEEPHERVWLAIRSQLLQEGVIHTAPETAPSHRWFRGWFSSLPRPALAGAYLAALVAVAFFLSGPVSRSYDNYRWISSMQHATAPLSAELNSAETEQVAAISDPNPEVSASFHSSLAIVDNYIALCEKSVQEDPEDEVARDYLYDAYHQKADLLAQISERGDYSR